MQTQWNAAVRHEGTSMPYQRSASMRRCKSKYENLSRIPGRVYQIFSSQAEKSGFLKNSISDAQCL